MLHIPSIRVFWVPGAGYVSPRHVSVPDMYTPPLGTPSPTLPPLVPHILLLMVYLVLDWPIWPETGDTAVWATPRWHGPGQPGRPGLPACLYLYFLQ